MEDIFIEFKKIKFKKLVDIKREIKNLDLIDLMKKFDIKLKT
jgi:hypothetical protein